VPDTVAIVGGGYGGIAVAKALDDVADVVLVEPRDAFVHNVAALRAVVDPQWTDKIFFPYDRLLDRGRVIRARAARVAADGVTTEGGERIRADYTVLATGSAYPFPAKTDTDDSAAAKARFHAAHAGVAGAERVLLLGAGPTGLEFAGEIAARWPDKHVIVLDPAQELLPRFPDEFRAGVRHQLDDLGVELLLGTGLTEPPATAAGERSRFRTTTRSGCTVVADIWFRCFGVVPATAYLADDLAGARLPNGHLEVTPQLRVRGHDRVFAVGDITAVGEAKTAAAAGKHAAVVAANIRALIAGGPASATHEVAPPAIALPLGPKAGLSYTPELGVLDAAATSEIKGAALMVEEYREIFNLG
jgi:apoptosis-inducing factor 2